MRSVIDELVDWFLVPLLLLSSFMCIVFLVTEDLSKPWVVLIAAASVIIQFCAGKVRK